MRSYITRYLCFTIAGLAYVSTSWAAPPSVRDAPSPEASSVPPNRAEICIRKDGSDQPECHGITVPPGAGGGTLCMDRTKLGGELDSAHVGEKMTCHLYTNTDCTEGESDTLNSSVSFDDSSMSYWKENTKSMGCESES